MKSLILILVSFSLFSLHAEEVDLKSFHQEGHSLRMEHMEKIYQLKKKTLDEAYERQKQTAAEIHKIELSIVPGDKEGNKDKRMAIRDLHKELKSQEQREENREELKRMREEFRSQMKERRQKLGKEYGEAEKEGRRGMRKEKSGSSDRKEKKVQEP